MKCLLILLFCLTGILSLAPAQYYYRDILETRRTAGNLLAYRQQGIRSVTLRSFEPDGSPTENFSGSQQLQQGGRLLITALQTPYSAPSLMKSHFNAAGQLIRTEDSTDGASSVNQYRYDAQGRLVHLLHLSQSAGQEVLQEEHLWTYNENGFPLRMIKLVNGSDSSVYEFIADERGNVAEERGRRKGTHLPTVYYYYDEQNRLTDIVRYNRKAGRLLPDYLFNYDAQGRLASMTVIPEGSGEYQVWRYTYNQAGLRSEESCYDKSRRLMGKISYEYR